MEVQGCADWQHKQEKAIGQMSFASSSKFLGHYSPLSANRSLPDQSPGAFRGMGQVPWAVPSHRAQQKLRAKSSSMG